MAKFKTMQGISMCSLAKGIACDMVGKQGLQEQRAKDRTANGNLKLQLLLPNYQITLSQFQDISDFQSKPYKKNISLAKLRNSCRSMQTLLGRLNQVCLNGFWVFLRPVIEQNQPAEWFQFSGQTSKVDLVLTSDKLCESSIKILKT